MNARMTATSQTSGSRLHTRPRPRPVREEPSSAQTTFLSNHEKPQAKVSVILLDWGVRESFHSLHYLNRQTVDRKDYELIWIDFYDRDASSLPEAIADEESEERLFVDKWIVLENSRDTCFHKHRMYNVGIVASEGEICVICDSDAIFSETFIENIIRAFDEHPESVVHLDQVRNSNRGFYPFNYPTRKEFFKRGCLNWTGKTTIGLDNSPDMLHEANYGACMAARRSDLIEVGGADEHLEFLGYICGPYELTFRLSNHGLDERWLKNEYLCHTWHPGESGINFDYQGPSDGRGISSLALESRDSGRVQPVRENLAISGLRRGRQTSRPELFREVVRELPSEWKLARSEMLIDEPPELMDEGVYGFFNLYRCGNLWHALAIDYGEFDPADAISGKYEVYYRSSSRVGVTGQLPDQFLSTRGLLQILTISQISKLDSYRHLKWPILGLLHRCISVFGGDLFVRHPELKYLNYGGYNIVRYCGRWYGISEASGGFDLDRKDGLEGECFRSESYSAVKAEIRRRTGLSRFAAIRPRLRRLAKRLNSPQPPNPEQAGLVKSDYRGFNILFDHGRWYGLICGAGTFEEARDNHSQKTGLLEAISLREIKRCIRRDPRSRTTLGRMANLFRAVWNSRTLKRWTLRAGRQHDVATSSRIEFAGWLPIFSTLGDCGTHPQFSHVDAPPEGYVFSRSDQRMSEVARGFKCLRYLIVLFRLAFIGRAASALFFRSCLRGVSPLITWKFLRSRGIASQIKLPINRDLAFLTSVPFTYGQVPWVIEIEDVTTLFFPFIDNGDTVELEIKETKYYPLVKLMLESKNCRGIVTHVQSTADGLKMLFGSETIDRKTHFVSLGVKTPKKWTPTQNADTINMLFSNSWHEGLNSFYVRGGIDVLEAYSQLHDRYPQLRLTIRAALNLNFPPKYRRLIRDNNIEVIQDFLPSEEFNDLFRSSDIYLLPSARLHIVSVMRAMSYGLVPVVSDGWGMEEYIDHQRNGLVVKGRYGHVSWMDKDTGMLRENYAPLMYANADVVAGIVKAVEQLVEDGELREQLSQNARNDVVNRFNLENWNDGLKRVFDMALGKA
jgi:glycosyltransferase involved in cell wall biosynthesis